MKTKIHRYTSFHTNVLLTTMSWHMEEDEWTVQLSKCLSKIPPGECNLELQL